MIRFNKFSESELSISISWVVPFSQVRSAEIALALENRLRKSTATRIAKLLRSLRIINLVFERLQKLGLLDRFQIKPKSVD